MLALLPVDAQPVVRWVGPRLGLNVMGKRTKHILSTNKHAIVLMGEKNEAMGSPERSAA